MTDYEPIHLLLSVVDPSFNSEMNIDSYPSDERFFSRTIDLAKENGLYYHFINEVKKETQEVPYFDKKFWEKEKERLEEYKESINLLNVLKNNDVTYSVIKASNLIPHIPRDVDIFVPPSEKEKTIEILEKNGMICEESGDIETALSMGDNIKLDIYTGIEYFDHEFIDNNFLIQSIKENEMFGIEYNDLVYEANFLLMTVHSLFGHGAITLLDFLHLKRIRELISDLQVCEDYSKAQNWRYAYDNFQRELDKISEKLYENNESVQFPYTFDIGFRLNCIERVKNLDYKEKSFLYVSFTWDKIFSGPLKNSFLYDTIKSIEPVRRLINQVGHTIRNRRGDKTS